MELNCILHPKEKRGGKNFNDIVGTELRDFMMLTGAVNLVCVGVFHMWRNQRDHGDRISERDDQVVVFTSW